MTDDNPPTIAGIPLSPAPVALAASGFTVAEIADITGMQPADVIAALAASGEVLSVAHVRRAELALLDEALGGETWAEQATPLGVVRLAKDRRPDKAALRQLLEAHGGEKYAKAAPAALTVNIGMETREQLMADIVRLAREQPAIEGEVIEAPKAP